MSVVLSKAWKDMRRRKARAAFTVATIAVAVSSLSLFALAPLIDRAMDQRVKDDALHDVQLLIRDAELSTDDLAALRALPGVAAVDVRTRYPTRVRIGERRDDALLIGVRDFDRQQVNIVRLESGRAPTGPQAVSDPQNVRSGRFSGGAGTVVQVEDTNGGLHQLEVSGRGSTLVFTQIATDDAVVLYVPQSFLEGLEGRPGTNTIDFRAKDPMQAAEVARNAQEWLVANRPDIEFTDLPDVREPGSWPGEDITNNFLTLFYVGGVLALLSAVALISNTMTTMVAEQVREIAIMKAIGGRRRHVMGSYLLAVLLLGAVGTVVGIAVGIPLSNYLAGFVGREFLGVNPNWGASLPVLGLSIGVGLVGTTLAAIPALRRAARISVREGLTAGTSIGTGSAVDRVLRAVRLPPAPMVGLRNVTRRKARTIGTIAQVSLAVAVALGFLALGVTVATVTGKMWDTLRWDVIVSQRANVPLDPPAARLAGDTAGVAASHPVLYNTIKINGSAYEAWGLPVEGALHSPDITSGRWLEPADGESRARVVVVGVALSKTTGLRVGETVTVETATGPQSFKVVGIDGRLINNGSMFFIPLPTFQEILGRDTTNALWILSASQAERDIDRLATSVEDNLTRAGYPVTTEIHYVEKGVNLEQNRTITAVLAIMGVPIVAIGLIGLVNLMTMNVLERTREIGMLRCIGARSRDIRNIVRTEALTVALVGWIVAVPLGWLIGRVLLWIVVELFNFGSVAYSFPSWSPPLALLATVGLAWLIVIPPVRRAASLRPGDALRYE